MKKSILNLSLGVVLIAVPSSFAQTQTPPATTTAPATAAASAPAAATTTAKKAPPPLSGYDKWENEMKNPAPWINWGADVRLRNEYFNNAITLNDSTIRHEQDYFRFRERIWGTATPVTNLSVNVRFSGEQREWMKPSYASQFSFGEGFESRYGILDGANVKWSNIGGEPLSITAGRQDVMLGDPLNWWLVADGTPGDGSWTFFLDSVRATYEAKEAKTKIDLAYVLQYSKPDEWMPTLGPSSQNSPTPYYLTEQNEQGAILYLSNKSMKNTQIDGYFIYKRDELVRPNSDNANIFTLGTKLTGTPHENWSYSAEGAYQFGSKQDATLHAAYVDSTAAWHDIGAWGANGKLTYLFKDEYNNQVSFITEYLSGDNPKTKGKDEMFDVLWGRWPRFSELYIYSYINETSGKIAQMNNIVRVGANWSVVPVKDTTFSATYSAWFAPHDTPTRYVGTGAPFSFSGNFRGHYAQAVIKHQFNKHVSGHLWGELVWMGDYYVNKDLMTFLRAEILLTF
jgi:hypothetical protein